MKYFVNSFRKGRLEKIFIRVFPDPHLWCSHTTPVGACIYPST